MGRDKKHHHSFGWASFPDGFLEDTSRVGTRSVRSESEPPSEIRETASTFTPVSITLATKSNILLNEEQGYDLKFSTGILEGSGLSINEQGNQITFQNSGSYRFELCGTATPFSQVSAKLLFFSEDMSEPVRPFAETIVEPKSTGYKLRGISTILPMETGQTISVKLVPDTPESIVVASGCRWMIHRVA